MLKRLLTSRQGSVTVLSAVAAPLLLVGVAVAYNTSIIVNTRHQLQDIADLAALKACKSANNAVTTNTDSNTNTTQAQQVAQETAEETVTNNVAASGISPTPTVTALYTASSQYSGSVTVTLSYTPQLILSGFLPYSQQPITVSSTASMDASNTYLQIIFLVDISNSMSVGGTAAEIQQLENTSNHCAFACHDNNGYYYGANQIRCTTSQSGSGSVPMCNLWSYAKAHNIDLKIDYVKDAMQNLVARLSDYTSNANYHITLSLITFGTKVSQLVPATTDMSVLSSALSSLDVETATPYVNASNNPYGNLDLANYNGGYTKITDTLTSMTGQIKNVGDGTSQDKMKTYVVFLSDGLQDTYSPDSSLSWRNVNVSYTAACTALKNTNAIIFSIWVPYYVDPSDSSYAKYNMGYLSGSGSNTMQSSMQNCASSSDDYFRADDGPAIQSAFNNTLDKIIIDSNLRISK